MPENGQADEKTIVAVNLQRLMKYAADHPRSMWPSSKKGLARWIEEHPRGDGVEVGRATIQRMWKGDTTACGVDSLGVVAQAYGLQAWQLLIPHLDPENPPVVSVTETERRLWQRMHDGR